MGLAVGAAAVVAIGVAVVFGLDLGSFWLSAVGILLMIRVLGHAQRRHVRGAAGTGLRDGFRVVKDIPGCARFYR